MGSLIEFYTCLKAIGISLRFSRPIVRIKSPIDQPSNWSVDRFLGLSFRRWILNLQRKLERKKKHCIYKPFKNDTLARWFWIYLKFYLVSKKKVPKHQFLHVHVGRPWSLHWSRQRSHDNHLILRNPRLITPSFIRHLYGSNMSWILRLFHWLLQKTCRDFV